MSNYEQSNVYYDSQDYLKSYILRVFLNMTKGLILTAVVAFAGYRSLASGGFLSSLVQNMPFLFIIILVVQLGLCLGLSFGLTKLSPTVATLLYYGYAVVTGITFSFLPYTYDVGTIFTAFLFAAIMFGSCAIIGKTTKVDLTRFGGLFMGALVAMLIATIVSVFVPVLRNSLVFSFVGIVLFLALTAYDMQKIKQMYYMSEGNELLRENLAIYGAFQLYLDFINIFLRILQVLGRNNNRD